MNGRNHEAIAFLINDLGIGGAERVFVRDANEFANRGYQVSFFVLYGTAVDQALASALDARIKTVYVAARGAFDFHAAWKIAHMCRREGIRVLYATLNDANIVARWVTLLSSHRISVVLRETGDPRRRSWWQWILGMVLDPFVARVITVSEEARRELLKRTPWRSRKIVTLHNSIDMPQYQHDRGRSDTLALLSVGNATPSKDYSTLIAALQELAGRGIRYQAKVIGRDRSGVLQDLSAEEGESIAFLGAMDHAALAEEYENADVFVLSSKDEGCPNVVLEAMSYGVPVVATAVGGVPELVENGETGILVPPRNPKALADALERIAADKALRRRFGDAGRERARNAFSPAKRFEHLVEIMGV